MSDYQSALIEAAQEFHAHEMGGDTPHERRYFAWLRLVEKALGLKSLDGDEREDGYSLDGAHDAFCEAKTVKEYVQSVKDKMATLPDRLMVSYGPGDEIPGSR